jgi:prolyl oligopeptidase
MLSIRHCLRSLCVAAAVSAASLAPMGAQALHYPVAHRDNTVANYFGTKVPEPYEWMDNLTSPALHQWVAAENKVTRSYLSNIPIRGWIDHRLTELWNYAKEGTPTQLQNGMLFFRRNSGLQNQSVVYVQSSPTAQPRVLLDPNTLSPDGSIALAGTRPSPGGKYLAYALSNGGSDWETIHVLNVATGKPTADLVHWVKFSGISWTHDGKGFFYSRYPEPPGGEKAISHAIVDQKLYYHQLGTPQSADKLIYARPDLPQASIGGNVSEDGHYLYIYLTNNSISNNELYYANLGNPAHPDVTAKIEPLYTQNDASYTPIGHIGSTLYLQTTWQAPQGRIVATSLAHPDRAAWKTIVPESKAVIASAALTDGKLLVNLQDVAKSRLEVFSTSGQLLHTLPLPTLGSVNGISARKDSPQVYYAFTSFLYPTTIYHYNVAADKTSVLFRPHIRFDASPYQTRQVFYPSKDGTMVPMFIVARKGIKLDGTHPTIMYAYGGFDITITPRFDPILPVWLELGGIYAVPNLRGGAVYGEKWHHAGMLGNKQNVFDDFAWAAKYLYRQGYTSPRHLAIQGYSNGGLLTGASITERPKLFGAAYIGHGVLDMLQYQKFSGGSFWVSEYGSSSNQKAFDWLIKYSPLDNIHKGTCYPPTLITTSWDDDRVVPSHEFKFAAKIQQAQGCSNPILLRTTGSTAHDYMPTDKEIQQDADVWAFEGWNIGVKSTPASH